MHLSAPRWLTRLGRWPRYCAAGLCVLLAALSAADARQAAHGPDLVPVVVAAHALSAGHVLTRRDLAVARWPTLARPAGTTGDPRRVLGARTAGPLTERDAITPARLLGNDLALGLSGQGLVATTVTLDDPGAADLAHAGDRVDLLETDQPPDDVSGAAAQSRSGPPAVAVVCAHARVLAVLPATDARLPEIVLAADRADAVRIARDRSGHIFTVVADPP